MNGGRVAKNELATLFVKIIPAFFMNHVHMNRGTFHEDYP